MERPIYLLILKITSTLQKLLLPKSFPFRYSFFYYLFIGHLKNLTLIGINLQPQIGSSKFIQ